MTTVVVKGLTVLVGGFTAGFTVDCALQGHLQMNWTLQFTWRILSETAFLSVAACPSVRPVPTIYSKSEGHIFFKFGTDMTSEHE